MKKLKSHAKTLLWAAVPVAAGIFLFWLVLPSAGYQKIPQQEAGAPMSADSGASSAPVKIAGNYYFIKDPSKKPAVSALEYLVGDLSTGEIILKKNESVPYPIASVSKLMTALVSEKTMQPDETVSATSAELATYGQNGNFHTGEKIQEGDLLYPLLLESSNDAAEMLAGHLGRPEFLYDMNQEAKTLGMDYTAYEDPSGLSAHNVSTAGDLFKLADYINKFMPNLFALTTRRNYSTKTHNWPSIDQFLSDPGYTGGKSGYTAAAKETAVATFNLPLGQSGTRPVAIIVLQSYDRHADVETLVRYLEKNIYYGTDTDADTAWVKEKEGVPEPKEPDYIKMAFMGDIMMDRGVRSSVNKNFAGDYSAMFEHLGLLKDFDVAFANLEGTASDKGADLHNLYSFRMDPAVVPALAGAGINVLSVANNHVGDWGRDAYTDTLSRLDENEILHDGGGMTKAEAETPAIIEKHGIKIGFIGFSDKGPDWMAATDTEPGLLLASDPDFDSIISNAAKQVDYLVVSFHFGEEYQTKHNARQAELAHRAIDDGAKLVIGAHPHVVEDTEVYKNGYIAYSLGNLIFDQPFSANTMAGGLLEVTLHQAGNMSVAMDTVKLNRSFQPEEVIKGKDEVIKFQTATTAKTQ
jgi:poly-gamma-glutamate synthesis protein (capsule biosynthesis protein)